MTRGCRADETPADAGLMRILLPPSETKLDGGDPSARLDLGALSFPALTPHRRRALRALTALSRNLTTMSAALRLGPHQRHELLRNRAVTRSSTMPAIERYSGVLYDAVDIGSVPHDARRFASDTIVIHSALFGLVGASDPIPAYRVSHDSRLPDLRLGELWRAPISAEIAGMDALVLDLRSDAYAALGPIPTDAERRLTLRVVAAGVDGTTRALTHFNKRGKGELTRAIVTAAIDHPDVDSLLRWAHGSGIRLAQTGQGVLELTVDGAPAAQR